MKILKILFIGTLLFTLGCKDGYIDEITAVDPGSDENAPTVKITYPTGDITIPFTKDQTDVEFSFQASDDIELQSIKLSLDGTQLETFSDFTDYRKSINSFMYEDLEVGEHTVTVSATDLSGKTTDQPFTFEVTNKYVPKDGEIFYMPFEGGLFTELVNEVDATPSGSPTFVDGISNGDAVRFEGASQEYLLFPGDGISGVESFTLSFWSNVEFVDENDDGGIDGILGLVNLSNVGKFWGNLDFFLENGSNPTDGADVKIHVTNGDSEQWITSAADVDGIFGAWAHHVLTYDASTSEFNYYINGEVMATATTTWDGFAFEDSGPMVMGCVQFQTDPSLTSATGSQGWASYLTGELDEIRIFNKALTATEVEALYEAK